jgi:pyranose oxidase
MKATKTAEVDTLVIGSGAVGATYARCLAGAGRHVCMIDSGPQLRSRPGHHLLNSFRYQHEPNLSLDEMMANHEVFSIAEAYNPAATIPPGIYAPLLERLNFENPDQGSDNMAFAGTMYAVGGMFSLWSCFAPIPIPAERTPFIEADAWPSILRSAIRLLNVHTDVFDSPVQDAIKETVPGVVNMPMGAQKRVLAGERIPGTLTYYVDWTGTDTILGDLLGPDNRTTDRLQILELHRAEKLVLSGGKVQSVLVRRMDNLEVIEFRANEVIVAGGTFLGARLLWQSGIRPDGLGRYLADNPVVEGHVGFNDKLIGMLRSNGNNPARQETVPVPWDCPPPKCGIGPSPENGRPWMVHLSRNGRTAVYPQIVYDVRLNTDISGYSTVDPNPDNRVIFSDKYTDRFGQPQMTIQYQMSQKDNERWNDLLAYVKELGEQMGGFYYVDPKTKTQGPFKAPVGTSLHLTGITRMGSDPAESVVDNRCKVWGYDNLYVGGQSVLPRSIASNPTLTCCAIAVYSCAGILDCSPEALGAELFAGVSPDPGMPLDQV